MSIPTDLQASLLLGKRPEETGYAVVLEPGPDLIPFELGGDRPEILAIKPGENILVQVILRLSLSGIRRPRMLSRFVNCTNRTLDNLAPEVEAADVQALRASIETLLRRLDDPATEDGDDESPNLSVPDPLSRPR